MPRLNVVLPPARINRRDSTGGVSQSRLLIRAGASTRQAAAHQFLREEINVGIHSLQYLIIFTLACFYFWYFIITVCTVERTQKREEMTVVKSSIQGG